MSAVMVEDLFAMEIKSANICRTEAGLGQFRTVKIPSEAERIKQKK